MSCNLPMRSIAGNEDDEHFDDLEYEDEDEEEDPWDLHDYEGESPESLQSWYNGRVL